MKNYAIRLLLCLLALSSLPAMAQEGAFSFGVIANAFRYDADEGMLRQALTATSDGKFSFIVATGVKTSDEPCSDELYMQRKALYDKAGQRVILTLGAHDWAECKRSNGESAAIERLQRVRDIYFNDPLVLNNKRITVLQQSKTEKFRSYSENLRWQIGPVWFATLNLPANNNHYLSAAGRNNEFEDRLVANQDWLQRLFIQAKASKAQAIVVFSEANPLARPSAGSTDDQQRDGYLEIRRQLLKLSRDFKGKVLIIHNGKPSRGASLHKLSWRGNVGEMGMLTGWSKITVNPAYPTLFIADLQALNN